MADRLILVDLAQPAEGHHPPVAIPLFPIQGGLPLLGPHRSPALREPQEGVVVAFIFHELQVVPVRDQARGQLEGLHKLAVPGSLIVKGEPISLMPNPAEPFGEGHPFQGGDARGARGYAGHIGRVERIAGEHMLDVRDHQFLMLLFMMQTQCKDGRDRCQLSLIDLLQQIKNVLIDIAAVLVGLLDGGPGDQTAIGSAVPFSQACCSRN